MQIPQFLKLFKQINRNIGWVSIVLDGHGVHCVKLKRSATNVEVQMCEFRQIENVTPADIERLVRDLNLGALQFTTLLAPDEYQILLVDAPNVPDDELKTAVRFRIKDSLNCQVDEAFVDVIKIPGNSNAGNRPQSLFAVAASNDTLKKRISLFEKAKIHLSVIDIPEMAQRNIAKLFETEGRGLAFLAFDSKGGLLTFTCDGEMYLARRLDVTAGQLLDANEENRQQYMERVELEIQRSLDYFDRQFHYITLERMLVSAPEGAGLIKMFNGNLGLPVEPVNLSQVLNVSAVPALRNNEFLTEALPAIGAALRQERRKQ
jgi:MSHA biogenesis protein MshI